MSKQQQPRRKHVPQRTCIACRQSGGKRGLTRLVRTADGSVEVDPTGKQPGRGAYLHPTQACWKRALDGRMIGRALRTQVSKENQAALIAYMAGLPEGEEEEDAQTSMDEA
ncbi:MAG: YlxR family protein [Caldilineaceae bacterium]|nr:YlxR family protein [Caldilineaceae bacterium]